ncbi:MAG: hypothetical protein J6W03_06860 [Bacteroidaceae bacterium]|nr:hypothetical protein [Bacteroidaceae bacterium]
MKRQLLLLVLLAFSAFGLNSTKAIAQNPDTLTFAVLGNSISTYYDYIPSGYAIYYTADRERDYGIQVGDQWWMQLSRLSGMTFLANASWSGSRVACDVLNSNAPFLSNVRVKALGRAGAPDFIFIAGGTNDWNQSKVPLGQYRTENFTDSVSFRGAYQRLLWKLTTWYPQARVVCLSILPRGEGVNNKNSQGWSQADANASIQHIAEQFGQYYIDCTTIPFSSNWGLYMLPGNLHPTAAGFTIMAQHIYNQMLSQGIITSDLKRSDEVDTAERLLDLSFTESGIVNQGTFAAKIGKHGTVSTYYDAEHDTYYGCTKAKSTDYYYAAYDEGSMLADAFNGNLTWEVLVRLDSQADADGNISRTCILGNEENGGWAFYNSPVASAFTFAHKSGVKSSVKSITGDSILVSGKFYHLVVTMDRVSHIMRYFINGNLVCTGTRAGTDMMLPQCGTIKGRKGMWICLGGDAKAGAYSGGAENSSACSFVFARIYDGALSQDAAVGLYNDDVKRFTEPQASHGTELLMDMQLTPTGALNYAPSYYDKPIEMKGEVALNFNSDINQYEAQFSGTKSQFFMYNVGNDPLLMNTLSDAYSVEVFCRTNSATPAATTRPIGFLNGYGFGLQMSNRGNVSYCTATVGNKADGTFAMTQWTATEDGILSDEYTHYVIVFDRLNYTSQLYINGQLESTRWLTFKECPVYEWTPSTWLAIGGDAKGNYGATNAVGTYPFLGDIAMVRIYGRALKKNEIKSLRDILTTQEMNYTLGYNGYAPVCLPYVWQVPEGCIAYVVSKIDSPSVILTPIAMAGECIPYGTPVILKGTARSTVTLTALNKSEVDANCLLPLSQPNLLVGVFPGRTLTANGGYYMKTTGEKIYRATGNVTLHAFSCYLPSDERLASYAIEEEDATGIGNISAQPLSRESEEMYNLAGQRISKPQRGINIKGRRKVLVR